MTSSSEPLLSIRNLSLAFVSDENPEGQETVLADVSLDIHPASTHALVGESGSGKSVTALSVLRLLEDVVRVRTSGQIQFKGRDLLALPMASMLTIRGNQIAMIFQEPMTRATWLPGDAAIRHRHGIQRTMIGGPFGTAGARALLETERASLSGLVSP